MDKNRYKTWLIVILVIANLLTASIIWMQTAKKSEALPKEPNLRQSESAKVISEALNLSIEQSKQYDKMINDQQEQLKKYNEHLMLLKRELAEELFNTVTDSSKVNLITKEIGEVQAQIEMIRFNHFNNFLKVCTPEQQEKLKPIIVAIFGRKPPKDELKAQQKPDDAIGEKIPLEIKGENGVPNDSRNEAKKDSPRKKNEEKSNPPSTDEKLNKLSDRLSLTTEQKEKIGAILRLSKQKDQELRQRRNPQPNEIEAEKDRNRKEEDDGIMKLLDSTQKKEYEKIIANRRK